MPYTLYKADGTPVTVLDNAIDSDFFKPDPTPPPPPPGTTARTYPGQGILFVGRNALDYGTPIAQNFLQMTEHFAGPDRPADDTSLQGQIWFNKSGPNSGALYVKTATNPTGQLANWQRILSVDSSQTGTIPIVNPSGTPKDGDIRVVGTVISIWAGGAWRQIFPAIYS